MAKGKIPPSKVQKRHELDTNTIPQVINQKGIELEKVSEMLREDSKFRETYEYAKKNRYTKLNKSIKITYNDGKIVTLLAAWKLQ